MKPIFVQTEANVVELTKVNHMQIHTNGDGEQWVALFYQDGQRLDLQPADSDQLLDVMSQLDRVGALVARKAARAVPLADNAAGLAAMEHLAQRAAGVA